MTTPALTLKLVLQQETITLAVQEYLAKHLVGLLVSGIQYDIREHRGEPTRFSATVTLQPET